MLVNIQRTILAIARRIEERSKRRVFHYGYDCFSLYWLLFGLSSLSISVFILKHMFLLSKSNASCRTSDDCNGKSNEKGILFVSFSLLLSLFPISLDFPRFPSSFRSLVKTIGNRKL